jgi:hypothetical protein
VDHVDSGKRAAGAGSVRRTLLIDAAIVAAITVFIALVSQRWTGFNSPDSEFYASLAIFGSDVTDRALEAAYTWTRLGYIAPVHALTSLFGIWAGFEIWRILLILLIVASIYSVVTIAGRHRVLAAVLATFVGLNTMVLAYVGNPYLTGTILAITFVLLALAVSQLGSNGSRGIGPFGSPRWVTAFISGLLAGWLIMLNPYAFVLGVLLWISVRIATLWRIRTDRVRRLLVDFGAAAAGTVIGFGVFLIAGLALFPGRSWLGTYLEWNSELDYEVFIGDGNAWQRDTALFVVILAIAAAIVSVIAQPRHRWAWAALAMSVMNVVATAAIMLVMPGPWLEAPHYVALLWPASLVALVLVFTSMSPGTREGSKLFVPMIAVVGVLTLPLLLWTGRFEGVIDISLGMAMFVVLLVLIVVTAMLVPRSWNFWIATLLVVTAALTFVSAQVWQNGRGQLGIYGQYPFRSAFVDFSYQDQMASKIDVEEFLIANTEPTDRVGIWTDADRLTADIAGMQIWGFYNLVSVEPALTRAETDALEITKPSVIAMYSPDRAQIDKFWTSLPPWSLPTAPDCITVPYLGVGTGEAFMCLTRLKWVG